MPVPAFVLVALLAAPPQAEAVYTVECTFTNPGYSGPCGVSEEVSAKEKPRAACRRILGCLNDPLCAKTYCNATTVRSGWRLVEVKRAGEPPAPR